MDFRVVYSADGSGIATNLRTAARSYTSPCRGSLGISSSRGYEIPIAASRTLQVVRVYDDDADGLPVLVVEDLSERAA